jgi:hypothetical protein
MKKYLLVLLSLLLVLVLAACQARPLDVGNSYMDALQRGDTEAMLKAVSDDVILVITGDPIFHNELSGKEALREYAGNNAQVGFKLELMGDPLVNGNQLIYPDRFAMDVFTGMGVEWVTGKDVLTIENGKITRDEWVIDEQSLAALGAAIQPTNGLTPEKLAGTWRLDGGPGVGIVDLRYNADGTYEMIRYIIDSEMLWDKGEYAIEGGDTVTLTTTEDYYCQVGDQGVYQLVIGDDGQLQSTVVEDACSNRKPPVEGPIFLTLYEP